LASYAHNLRMTKTPHATKRPLPRTRTRLETDLLHFVRQVVDTPADKFDADTVARMKAAASLCIDKANA
jgi:hypothetical protein